MSADHECEFFLMNDISAHVCECGNVIIGYNGAVGIEYVEKSDVLQFGTWLMHNTWLDTKTFQMCTIEQLYERWQSYRNDQLILNKSGK